MKEKDVLVPLLQFHDKLRSQTTLTTNSQLKDLVSNPSHINLYHLQGPQGFQWNQNLCATVRETNGMVSVRRYYITSSMESLLCCEIELLKKAQHENVLHYVDSFIEDNKFLWIVSEFVDGGTLTDIFEQLESIQFEESQLAYFVLMCLRGIHYLQSHGIPYELQSDCVLLSLSGHIKLSSLRNPSYYSRRSTVGTPYWLSPDYILNKSPTNDNVWSLGVMLWEAITGEPPYIEFPPIRALFVTITEGIPPLSSHLPLSGPLVDFLCKCTERNTAVRSSPSLLLEHPFLKHPSSPDQFATIIHQAQFFNNDWG
uniref:Protein kinase domain-containing protein n=1 Tax=Arcella intermedia TaxID=1963864 RepID=A0A6B2LAB2_9EUKA